MSVGSSVEVIQHHSAAHQQTCAGGREREVPCPCGAVVALVCPTCDEPLFLAGDPDACEHARELAVYGQVHIP